MNYYVEIKLQPDAEFSSPVLMNALFSKLHKVLFDMQSNDIGVSFPDYGKILGERVRIHGEESRLKALCVKDWIQRMRDYCQVGPIQKAPEEISYRVFSRRQEKMNSSRLKRLLARQEKGKRGTRTNLTEKSIEKYKQEMLVSKQNAMPYLELKSNSNGNVHRRYIQFGELSDTPVQGKFDTFGLSKTATVPWF
jgi:CRISPR-associated endonuclease Csy4